MAANRQLFQVLTALPLALVAVGCFYTWREKYISHPDGTILVITNKDEAAPSAGDFSKQVVSGAYRAQWESTFNSKPPNIEEIPINPQIPISELTYRLSQKITQQKILGIISGGTSQTDEPLARLCRHLHIPLLMGVATNDRLTDQGGLEERVVYRMLPNNSRQAESIANKAESLAANKDVILIYENNSYGNFLHNAVLSKIRSPLHSTSYVVDDSKSIPAIMPLLERSKDRTSVVIYLGYAERAISLLEALRIYDIQIPVILSDGCFSTNPDLREIVRRDNFAVWLAFPADPWPQDRNQLTGFELYGYNAFILLAQLDKAVKNFDPPSLLAGLNDASDMLTRTGDGKTVHQGFVSYRFDEFGEPLTFTSDSRTVPATFIVIRVSAGAPRPSPAPK
jgi:hypothetical protein